MKKTLLGLFVVLIVSSFATLTSCGKEKNTITIGTMAQPGQPIIEHIKDEFEQKTGKTLKVSIYTDFSTPNQALATGEIDANLFQHQPFLNAYNTNNKQDLATACIMYDCAYGGYTKKSITSLDQIPNNAKITIANDASNMKRCLDILVAEKLIEVNYATTDYSTLNPDNINNYITTNTKNLEIAPISTSLIAASLNDTNTYLGIVNATFAIAAGLGSSATLLCQEKDPTHANANIVAIRNESINEDWVKVLVEILTSSSTDQFVKDTFGSTITPYHGTK